jgi:hypothetical protein
VIPLAAGQQSQPRASPVWLCDDGVRGNGAHTHRGRKNAWCEGVPVCSRVQKPLAETIRSARQAGSQRVKQLSLVHPATCGKAGTFERRAHPRRNRFVEVGAKEGGDSPRAGEMRELIGFLCDRQPLVPLQGKGRKQSA